MDKEALRARVYPRIYDLSVLSDRNKRNSLKLWDFYQKAGFLYEGKLGLLEPLQNQIFDTYEKLLCCPDNTCEIIFIADKGELIGSVMAARYTNDTWMIQHIVALPGYRMAGVPKELILSINSWMLKNKEMKYFINFFRPTTRWAMKTFYGIMGQVEDRNYMDINSFDYVFLDISKDYSELEETNSISIREMLPGVQEEIYSKLIKIRNKIVINSLGIFPENFAIEEVRKKYSQIGLMRQRLHLIAEYKNEIVGFAFIDISSAGISLSHIFDAFHIYAFNESIKELVIFGLLNRINMILTNNGKIHSIGLVSNADRIIYEKAGYKVSKEYLCFAFSRNNDQFLRTYDIVNSGERNPVNRQSK